MSKDVYFRRIKPSAVFGVNKPSGLLVYLQNPACTPELLNVYIFLKLHYLDQTCNCYNSTVFDFNSFTNWMDGQQPKRQPAQNDSETILTWLCKLIQIFGAFQIIYKLIKIMILNIGSFHVKTANFQKNSHLTLSDFAEISSKWVFW